MKRSELILRTGLALALCCLVSSSAHAGVLGPRKPSDLVTLITNGSTCSPISFLRMDTQIHADGTSSPFSIPAGEVLVLTGVDWDEGGASGGVDNLVLALLGADYSVAAISTGPIGANGYGGASTPLSGIVVKPGTSICVTLNSPNTFNSYPVVHGFLTADK